MRAADQDPAGPTSSAPAGIDRCRGADASSLREQVLDRRPVRGERHDIQFPVFSFCGDWQPRIVGWSQLSVLFARFDPTTYRPTTEYILYSFAVSAEPEAQIRITSANGATVGDPLDRWTELHPEATVEMAPDAEDRFYGPHITLRDGLVGSFEVIGDLAITSIDSGGPPICAD